MDFTGRRWALVSLLIMATLLAGSERVLGQVKKAPVSATATFRPISELQPPAGATVQLIGGTPASPKDWPASFYSFHGGGACTSTLVGPRALLTAAHCLTGATAVIVYQGAKISATCSYSTDYDPSTALGETADWALCLLAEPLSNPPEYERISTGASAVAVGTPLVLTGFGCTRTNMTGGNDGIFRTGIAPVVALPSAVSYDIVTKVTPGEPTICPGDSGGGAYVASADLKRRIQVSVNSRTMVVTDAKGVDIAIGESFLSSLSVAPAIAFINDWMAINSQTICGVTPNMGGCRQAP